MGGGATNLTLSLAEWQQGGDARQWKVVLHGGQLWPGTVMHNSAPDAGGGGRSVMLAAEVMVGHGLQGRVHKRQGFRAIYSNDEQIDCGRLGAKEVPHTTTGCKGGM